MINEIFLLFGLVLGIGFIGGIILHHLRLTGVLGYILVGVLLSPSGIDIVGGLGIGEGSFQVLYKFVVPFFLGLIGFRIGMELSKDLLSKLGKPIIAITLSAALLSLLLVFVGVYLYTGNFALAILLGCVASATAPGSMAAVIQEHRARGPMTSSILAIVGIDDAVAILLFMFAFAAVKASLGAAISSLELIMVPLREILGGLALGGLIGGIFSFGGKEMIERGLMQKEFNAIIVLASVVFGVGLAEILGFSSILTCMAIGIALVNLPFPWVSKSVRESIIPLMGPFYIIFFVFAGMHLHMDLLLSLGPVSAIYAVARASGKIFGVMPPVKLMEAPPYFKYMGIGLLSQGGVAIGLASFALPLLAGIPGGLEIGTMMFTVVLTTDILFEILGPVGARSALARAGEIEGA